MNRSAIVHSVSPMLVAAAAVVAALAVIGGCTREQFDSNKVGSFLDNGGHKIASAAGHEKNAITLTDKDEDGIGQAVGVRLSTEYGVYDRAKMLKYVTLVGLTVASASPNPGGNYVFGILDTDQINAFSGPNGYIFITRGALEQMVNEAELAGVLAHEIAHVCHHDGLTQVRLAEQQTAVTTAVSATQVQQFSQMADQGVEAIAKKGYSQPEEFSADETAVDIMSAAGYDPHSYENFLKRLARVQQMGKVTVMSTHPGIHDRIARVEQEIATLTSPGTATLAGRFAANVNFPPTTQPATTQTAATR